MNEEKQKKVVKGKAPVQRRKKPGQTARKIVERLLAQGCHESAAYHLEDVQNLPGPCTIMAKGEVTVIVFDDASLAWIDRSTPGTTIVAHGPIEELPFYEKGM